MNIPSSGLRLRPEFTTVCDHANIPPSHLITLDDFPVEGSSLKNIRWILVDHNKLQGELGKRYASKVHGVIDHHDEEEVVPADTDPEPRIVEKCGSCTSLVVRYCRASWDNSSSSALSSDAAHGQDEAAIDDRAITQGWDAQIAKMALASILIDTANLTAPGKVADVDKEAVEYLEGKIRTSATHAKSFNRDDYYDEIDNAKKDIDSLTLSEILSKDYKQWTESGLHLGMSSVVKPLDYLVKKADTDSNVHVEGELRQFMDERDLAIFAIMTTSTSADGDFIRELLVQARNSGFQPSQHFAERAISAFQLEEIEVKGIPTQSVPGSNQVSRKIWLQRDVSKSRKQVAPILRESMRGNPP